ncbi:MAG: penicillin acylase family protein [Myxococcota bacterium]
MAVRPGAKSGRGAPGPRELGLRLLGGAALILLALFALQRWRSFGLDARGSLAESSGTIRIAGLGGPVEILRDGRGIPHIYARREPELWFGVGFAHAEDRLGQMIALRRRAYGRSAEREGEAVLPADRLARLLEIEPASRAAAESLPAGSRAVLAAYSAGVNARITRIRGDRASAPSQLGEPIAEVEPWQPADSLAVVKLLSWCMGGTLETTLVLDELIQRLDSVPARPFFPGRASVDFGVAPSLPMLRSFESGGARPPAPSLALDSTRMLCRGIGQPTGGAWIVGAGGSASGAPLLVADWQVAPSTPALFHELQISGGGLDALGATVPGSPIFWIARTPRLAWAGLPAGAPIADLFIETLGPQPGSYQSGRTRARLVEREEVLRFLDRGGSLREEKRVLRSTRHGPLIDGLTGEGERPATDAAAGAEGAAPPAERETTARSLAWTGARAGDGLSSMLALLRLDGVEGIASVLAGHHEPVLALVYADRSGQGGVQVAGWLPHRPLPTGLVPVEGRLESFDWRHRVAIDALPALRLAPGPRPYLVMADQAWPSGEGRGDVEFLWRPGDRAERIEAALEARLRVRALDLREAAEMLADDGTQRAAAVVRALLSLARRERALDIEAEEIAGILERWDGDASVHSAGAAAYHLVVDRLLENLLREPFGPELYARYLNAPHVRPQDAIERLVMRAEELRRPGGWTDEARVTAAARRSLREAWVALGHRLGPARERWEWGELHRMRFEPFAPFGVMADFLFKGLRTGGSAASLDAAAHRPGVSLEVESASLYRVAMDLSAGDRVLSSLAPGQNEQPGHPNFSDGIARFRSGRLALFTTDRLAVEEESVARLVMEPAR